MGQKPRLISSLCEFKRMPTFHNEYQHKPDFPLNTASDRKHLNISNLSSSDSAFYYCARMDLFDVEFSDGFFVSVKTSGLNVPALGHQSAPESVHQTCTLHPGSCGGEHSVFCFRDSGESHLGFIYTQGGNNGQCERNDSAQTHTCVYNQPIKCLNVSPTGTYNCAVASCGLTLLGNGTKLHIQSESLVKILFCLELTQLEALSCLLPCDSTGDDDDDDEDSLVPVYVLSAASAVTTILCVCLALLVCTMTATDCCLCGGK